MKAIGTISAALLALTIGTGAAAAAMQQPPAMDGDSLVTRVQIDCHPDVRRHYLPEYGRRVWHRHRQSNCRIILADPDFDDGPRDCHRDVRRHYLPEYGRRVYHRHVGERCRIRVYDEYRGDGYGDRNCVQIGPVRLCESRDY
jgi:hypothetical protein